MTDQKPDAPFSWQTPFTAPDEKPVDHDKDEKTPAEKAAATRAKHKREEARAEKRAAQDAAEAEPTTAASRTYSCPACGRGTTLATDDGPDGPMQCDGCGVTSDTWLPPGQGHGEPSLQV